MARALLTDSLARKLTAACGSKITYDAGPNRIPGLSQSFSAHYSEGNCVPWDLF